MTEVVAVRAPLMQVAYPMVGAGVFQVRFDQPLSDAEVDRMYDVRRVGLMLGLRDADLPADITAFWTRHQQIVARLENNPVVQDVLHNGQKKTVLAAALPLLVRRPEPPGDEAPARHHHLDTAREPAREARTRAADQERAAPRRAARRPEPAARQAPPRPAPLPVAHLVARRRAMARTIRRTA